MLKSSKLVLAVGTLLGVSVAVLPNTSFAAVTIKQEEQTVKATIKGLIGFTAMSHEPEANVTTYDSVNNAYVGTFNLMDHTESFGTTTYRVMCNYRSGTPYHEDDTTTPASYYANTDCANGWEVKAKSTTKSTDNYATMVGSTTGAVIKSTSVATNPLTGTTANWVMKINGISKTVNNSINGSSTSGTSTFSSSAAGTFGSFSPVPAVDAVAVAEGNTFRTVDGAANTYIQDETFSVQYGFNAGMNAVADTYTGTITYTLHVKAAN